MTTVFMIILFLSKSYDRNYSDLITNTDTKLKSETIIHNNLIHVGFRIGRRQDGTI